MEEESEDSLEETQYKYQPKDNHEVSVSSESDDSSFIMQNVTPSKKEV